MGKSSSLTVTLTLLGKLRQQPRVPLAKGGRRQLGCRYLRQQGSGDCLQRSVGKGNDNFANSLVCQQHRSMLLANPLDKAVGKEAQLCQQFALPTAWAEAVGKADARFGWKPSFANSLGRCCWQSWEFLICKTNNTQY
jgi:hypothetical protein